LAALNVDEDQTITTSPDAQLLADFSDADTVLNALNLPTTTDVHRRLQNAAENHGVTWPRLATGVNFADALSAPALRAPVLLPVPLAFPLPSK
jgi:hypothetical protein